MHVVLYWQLLTDDWRLHPPGLGECVVRLVPCGSSLQLLHCTPPGPLSAPFSILVWNKNAAARAAARAESRLSAYTPTDHHPAGGTRVLAHKAIQRAEYKHMAKVCLLVSCRQRQDVRHGGTSAPLPWGLDTTRLPCCRWSRVMMIVSLCRCGEPWGWRTGVNSYSVSAVLSAATISIT